jgi:hypothetical protein
MNARMSADMSISFSHCSLYKVDAGLPIRVGNARSVALAVLRLITNSCVQGYVPPLSISVRRLPKLVEPPVKLAIGQRASVRCSRYGLLQSSEEGALQQSLRASSALTRLHCVQVLAAL